MRWVAYRYRLVHNRRGNQTQTKTSPTNIDGKNGESYYQSTGGYTGPPYARGNNTPCIVSPRFLLYPLMALLPALGMLTGFSSAAGDSTPASQAASAAAIARAAIKQLTIGQHANDQRAPGTPRTKGLTDVQSTNWSGYADTGSGFSKVTGSWTEPSASCGGFTTSLAAFWVGIDGYNSASVEQDGTLIECYFGTAYQYTWWEMYPANDIQVVGQSLRRATASAPRWSGAAQATRSRSPIPLTPPTASPPSRAARAARTAAPSGSRKRRAAHPVSTRCPISAPGQRRARP